MLSEIPVLPPATPLLDAIDQAASLRELNGQQLLQLAEELRAFLLYSVGQSGGHFGAGLGVVELTVALHHVFHTPHDRIVWDVGHQTYPDKILTGRMGQMHNMRQAGGLSGFPKRSESEYDTFGVGHSSTSISAAMGMALAARQQGLERKVIAVIGDGAITGGMAVGDSLVQQVLGHGLAARLSARLGEGVLNGMLTARVGLSAMAVCRPMPFATKKAPGVSDVAPFLFGGEKGGV